MSWRVTIRPEVETDLAEAIVWYDAKQLGLGQRFAEEVFSVWDNLELNPRLNARRHPSKDIRWRFPPSFPYRVIYELDSNRNEVVILGVMHAARHESAWQERGLD